MEDIEHFFHTKEEALAVYSLFDKDSNGDASREEIEIACLWVSFRPPSRSADADPNSRFSEFHREQLSIENSMRDLDSAVGRLDNILMSVYVIIAVLIIAVAFVRNPPPPNDHSQI